MSNIYIYKPDSTIPLPSKAHLGDAGIDLPSAETFTLHPGERRLVGTGIYLALPPGTVGLGCPRSGLAVKHGLSIVNAPGVIDENYRGEIKVCLINLDPSISIKITKGDKIAQLLIQKVEHVDIFQIRQSDWEEECRITAAKQELANCKVRGSNGFGSSGL